MRRNWYLPSIAVLVLLLATGLWLRDASRPQPPNLIILTVESWRADAATRERMPNLFSAAAEGTYFTRHRAISAWTAPNIIAVLTGLSPFDQKVHARGQSIAASRHVFLEELAEAGWRVGGLQSFMTIDVFRNLGLTVTPGKGLLPWLAERARDNRPFVLWYHYLQTHLPYAPSPSFRHDYEVLAPQLDSATLNRLATVQTAPVIPAGTVAFQPADALPVRVLYEGGVAEFDSWFATFWYFFNRAGLRETTILVVTADHGEELLERGNVGHASTTRAGHLHEEIVRIPLFVWLPRRAGFPLPPSRVDVPTDHTDIVPMLRFLLAGSPDGAASSGLFDSNAFDETWTAATSFGGYADPDPEHPSGFEVARVENMWKLRLRQMRGGPVEPSLYDLASDPGERTNKAEHAADKATAMSRDLLPKLIALWQTRSGVEAAPVVQNLERPQWVTPRTNRVLRYADVARGVRLEWTGAQSSSYLVEYHAGDGAKAMEGTLEVKGTVKDFGIVGEVYWRTWVAPYSRVRLRVMPVGREDLASSWLELEFRP